MPTARRRSFAHRLARIAAAAALGVAALLAWQAAGRPQPAPDLRYTLLDGTRSGTDALRGKVVLVNFWATSCAPCLVELPRMADTQRKYQARGLETLAVAMQYDTPTHVARYAEARRLPFQVAMDDTGEIARRFGDVRVTPTTLLINRRGEIVERIVGETDFARLHRRLEELLAEPAA